VTGSPPWPRSSEFHPLNSTLCGARLVRDTGLPPAPVSGWDRPWSTDSSSHRPLLCDAGPGARAHRVATLPGPPSDEHAPAGLRLDRRQLAPHTSCRSWGVALGLNLRRHSVQRLRFDIAASVVGHGLDHYLARTDPSNGWIHHGNVDHFLGARAAAEVREEGTGLDTSIQQCPETSFFAHKLFRRSCCSIGRPAGHRLGSQTPPRSQKRDPLQDKCQLGGLDRADLDALIGRVLKAEASTLEAFSTSVR
jgi:hypothetical protein